MYKLDRCQDGRVAMLPAATRNYVSSILTPDFKNTDSLGIPYMRPFFLIDVGIPIFPPFQTVS